MANQARSIQEATDLFRNLEAHIQECMSHVDAETAKKMKACYLEMVKQISQPCPASSEEITASYMRASGWNIDELLNAYSCRIPNQDDTKKILMILSSPEFATPEMSEKYYKCSEESCFFCQMYIWNVSPVVDFFEDKVPFNFLNHYQSLYKYFCMRQEETAPLDKLHEKCRNMTNFDDVHASAKHQLSVKMERNWFPMTKTWYDSH